MKRLQKRYSILFLLIPVFMIAQNISPEFPFESKYTTVLGSKIHYVDEYSNAASGELTFLFIHGNPTSSYLWRNIIPYVKGNGRAIALDLIGMGKSDKPDIEYTYRDHIKYVNGFIDALALKNIVLVVHDWGSALGFHYAAHHESNVKGIIFMEAITKPMSWKDANLIERYMFKRYRDPKKGHKIIAKKNNFMKMILFKMGVKRKLSDTEKAYYNHPYPTVASRKPIAVWPREIPIEGEPKENHKIVAQYAQWLRTTPIPKLFLYATPGMVIKKKEVQTIQKKMPKLTAVHVGKGTHFIQEDHPHTIGKAIQNWASHTFK